MRELPARELVANAIDAHPGVRARSVAMTVHFCIRDTTELLITQCQDLGSALRQGQRLFPGFEQRNPWIFHDSLRQRIHVLLDPEIQIQRNTAGKRDRHA
jgi:hypothetical protein